jgi:hypothetical protein
MDERAPETPTDSVPRCGYCGGATRPGELAHCEHCGAPVAGIVVIGEPAASVATCVVCKSAINDPGIRRCPNCGSRYVRPVGMEGTGGPGAASGGAAAVPIVVLASPGGPPRKPPDKLPSGGALLRVGAMAVGVVLVGLSLTAAVTSSVSAGWTIGAFFLGIVAVVAAASMDGRGLRKAGPGRGAGTCGRCGYGLPTKHHGRCTECGALIRPLAEEARFCPKCRRALRGFRGDHCPECNADVRAICEPAEATPAG